MLTMTLINDDPTPGNSQPSGEAAVSITDIHSIRCTEFTVVLMCPTGPRTLVIDPYEGVITWDGRTYTEWRIVHNDPTCSLQLVCGPGELQCQWGPIAYLTMQADRLDACFRHDDPIDGPWLTWWITETGALRVEGTAHTEWRILEWSNDMTWERWKHWYDPIELPAPAEYGLSSDPYCCVGPTYAPLMQTIPGSRCWKLIQEADRFYIVPQTTPGEALGFLVTKFDSSNPRMRVVL